MQVAVRSSLTDSAPRTGKRLKAGTVKLIKQNIPLMIMFLPGLLFYVIFKYAPMGGIIIAFKDFNLRDGVFGSPWVGMDNFVQLFNQAQSLQIIRNSFIISILSLVVGFPMPILLAILLNEVRKMAFKRVVQTLVYLPHFLSWVIVGGIVLSLFALESGTVNRWLEGVLSEPYPFMYEKVSWLIIYLGSGIWKEMGFAAIIYLAALAGIDPHLYEAGSIDGANKWQQIRHITIPGIGTTIILLLILSVGKVMDVGFDQIYNLQNAVVSDIANVISLYIYQIGILRGQYSLTAAMGIFENLVGLVLVLSANYFARKFNQGLW
ncbi:ABC transporter permease [Paenibacillus arenilitoris]|uniref:Sugar ABC transporter permease n=1 Tax=Paenibacillus arenilitoris TaxID=2772299 RepID=A0A927CK22_9BACL|nr:ABC transporter permease subunit [Paenibacillus arenilitoris]MBD2867326.1 sugar ABC transporter permease [Paenibacillus arenilitoris]